MSETKRPMESLLEIWKAIQAEADAFWKEPLEPQEAFECVARHPEESLQSSRSPQYFDTEPTSKERLAERKALSKARLLQ